MNKFENRIMECRVIHALEQMGCGTKHHIHKKIYRGGYPVIGVDDVFNAIRRLERQGAIEIDHYWSRGWFVKKYYRLKGKTE